MGLNKIDSATNWGQAAADINTNFETIAADVIKVKDATTRNKGYFATAEDLFAALPSGQIGDVAFVGAEYPFKVYRRDAYGWAETGEYGGESVDLHEYPTKEELNAKLSTQEERINEETDIKISGVIVQETGDGEGVVMSQKAVSEKLAELGSEVDSVESVTNSLNIISNETWNDSTGKVFEGATGNSRTDKLLYNKNKILHSADTYQALYWDVNNNYLGYSNNIVEEKDSAYYIAFCWGVIVSDVTYSELHFADNNYVNLKTTSGGYNTDNGKPVVIGSITRTERVLYQNGSILNFVNDGSIVYYAVYWDANDDYIGYSTNTIVDYPNAHYIAFYFNKIVEKASYHNLSTYIHEKVSDESKVIDIIADETWNDSNGRPVTGYSGFCRTDKMLFDENKELVFFGDTMDYQALYWNENDGYISSTSNKIEAPENTFKIAFCWTKPINHAHYTTFAQNKDINRLKEELLNKAGKDSVTTLEKSTSANTSEINALKPQVSKNTNDIAILSAKSTNIESSIVNVRTKLDKVEQDAALNTTKIESINESLSKLSSDTPSGAITGDNVWTGANEFTQETKGVPSTSSNGLVTFGQVKDALNRVVDAADFGFSPLASADTNTKALNNALMGGYKTVNISKSGEYNINDSILIYSNTTLNCANGVVLKKTKTNGSYSFMYTIRNVGSITRTIDENIRIIGLTIDGGGYPIDKSAMDFSSALYGCTGDLLLYCVKDIIIEDLKIRRVPNYGVQMCTFENVIIHNFDIQSGSDGIHINRGFKAHIYDGVIKSKDDAIALNASDWLDSCPEVGSISHIVIDNIQEKTTTGQVGYFTRHLVGAWVDWFSGMEVQRGDKVVSNGAVYRCDGAIEGNTPTVYTSNTQPTFTSDEGSMELDGIMWRYCQGDATYRADITNITYRNIVSESNRKFCNVESYRNSIYDRSIYPTVDVAQYPICEDIVFENIDKSKSVGVVVNMSASEQSNTNDIKMRYTLRNVNCGSNKLIVGYSRFRDSVFYVDGCRFNNNESESVIIVYDVTTLYIYNCIYNGSLKIVDGGMVKSNCNLTSLPTTNLNAKGGQVFYNNEPYYHNGSQWVKMI